MENSKKSKIIFFGSNSFSIPILEALLNNNFNILLVITKSDKAAGRGRKEKANPLKKFAQDKKLSLKEVDQFSDNGIKEIESKKADIYVVAAFGLIIPGKLLVSPRGIKTINIHPSLLPKYRGASPIEAAILNGDKKTGTTIMVMDKELDKGPIIAQEEVAVSETDDFVFLSEKLQSLSSELLIEVLPDYLANKITPKPQDDSKASYCKELKKEDGKLDFTKTGEELLRQIRAYSHWPGSFASWKEKGKLVKIISAELETKLPEPPFAAGLVFKTESGKPALVCGDNALLINTIQLEGKKPIDSKDFLNGHQDFLGSTLN